MIVPQFIRIRFLLYLMRADGANGAFVKNVLMRDGGKMINALTASAAVELAERHIQYVLRKKGATKRE